MSVCSEVRCKRESRDSTVCVFGLEPESHHMTAGGKPKGWGGGSGGVRVVDRVCVCACVHVCEEEATKPNSFR